jgi:hypothetical protein
MSKRIIVKDIKQKVEQYCNLKRTFKVRESVNYAEITTEHNQKIVSNKNGKFGEGLFLFAMVLRDVKNYLEENGAIEPMNALPVNFTNSNYEEDKAVGIDVDNAYWSVACLRGYITHNTYTKGLEKRKDYKSTRLSALSSLGKDKFYKVFEKGEHKHNEIVEGDKRMQDIYYDIRFTTYNIMQEVADALGNDFYSWKTDCIFFKDTKENRDLVKTMLTEYGLSCKVEKTIDVSRRKMN